MHRAIGTFLVICAVCAPRYAVCGAADTLTVIHVNDTHAHLSAGGPRLRSLEGTRGGIARAATLIRALEVRSPNPWFLHAGDVSVGDLVFNTYGAVPELRILLSLGCRAMAVGNHEWDSGPEALDSALSSAFPPGGGFPLLSANTILDDPRVRMLKRFIRPFITGRAGRSTIGIFGLTTPETNLFSSPAPAVVDTPFAYAAAAVDSLRARGCAAVICLSHLGISLDRQIAQSIPGIDVIVGGHDHITTNAPVAVPHGGGDTTWIVQAGQYYEEVGVLRLILGDGHVRLLDAALLTVDSSVAKDREIDSIVVSLERGVESKYGPVFSKQVAVSGGFFAELADSLTQKTHCETPAGTLVTDAFRDLTGTDIAIEPGGSTSGPLEPGPVVADDCYRVIGYGSGSAGGAGYPLVRFDMTAPALIKGLEIGLSDIESGDEYFLQSSGLRYTYDPGRPPGERFVSATVAGARLRPDRVYSVTANYFVREFLDRLGVPYSGFRVYGGDTTEYMALLRYVRNLKTPTPVPLSPPSGGFPFNDTSRSFASRASDIVSRMTLKEKIAQMQNSAPAISRLGLPAYNWWSEALHGVAFSGIATVFPQAIGMASTWDPALIHAEADVISTEARAKHNEALRRGGSRIFEGLTFWSPNINIFRDPRWGRGQETFGEDPFLTSRIGVAFVRGLQGDDPKHFKVISTPKHFAVHSGPEQLRHRFDARTTRRDLYETYLPAFEACVKEGGAYSVMGAYNRYDGVPCNASTLLLGKNLRGRWGFPGYVVSDCGAITDIYAGHHVAANAAEASALAVKAGCDLTCGNEYVALEEAVAKELISEREIDVSVRRLMTARIRLGMFDPEGSDPWANIPFSANDTPEHRRMALDVARESIVLLRNSGNVLPLRKDFHSVAVIGPDAADRDVLLGNYNGTPSASVTVLQGIREKLPGGVVRYARGCEIAEGISPEISAVPAECLSTGEGASAVRGLRGEYFPNMELAGAPAYSRVDSAIDFSWEDSPAPGVAHEGFSVRWKGRITPAVPGTYYFGVTVDDGARLYVDGNLFIDDWHDGPSRRLAKEIVFRAGESHDITLEYYQDGGATALKLGWLLNTVDPAAEAVELARQSDAIIAVMGISPALEGEEMSVHLKGFSGGDRTDIVLPGPQRNLLHSLVALGKPIVLVLINGSALAIPWENDHVGGIVEAWYPGEEGGRAVADVLFGDYNPAGRLPVTFYRSVDDLPPFDSYAMEGRTYRYFRGQPLYPFGYGLSYTHFEYRGVTVSKKLLASADSVCVNVALANAGDRAGDEVVELYVEGPDARPGAPLRSLKSFARVHLNKGEQKSVPLTLRARDLRVYDESRDRYVVRPGPYRLLVGGSSADLPLKTEVRITG